MLLVKMLIGLCLGFDFMTVTSRGKQCDENETKLQSVTGLNRRFL